MKSLGRARGQAWESQARNDSSWLDLQPNKYIPEEVSPAPPQGYWPSRLRPPCWGPLQRKKTRGKEDEGAEPDQRGPNPSTDPGHHFTL